MVELQIKMALDFNIRLVEGGLVSIVAVSEDEVAFLSALEWEWDADLIMDHLQETWVEEDRGWVNKLCYQQIEGDMKKFSPF